MALNQSVEDFRAYCRAHGQRTREIMEAAMLAQGQRLAAAVNEAAPKGKSGRLEQSATAEFGSPEGTTTDFGGLIGSVSKAGQIVTNASVAPGTDTSRVIVTAGGVSTTKPEKKGRGTDDDYAVNTEFGTRHERARPFFYPTYRRLHDSMVQALADAFGESESMWRDGYAPSVTAGGPQGGSGAGSAGSSTSRK